MKYWFWLGWFVIPVVSLGVASLPDLSGALAWSQVSNAWVQWRDHDQIRTNPATAVLQAGLNQTNDKINLHIIYTGEQQVVGQGSRQRVVSSKNITAAEVIINGTSRQVKQIAPSGKGTLDIAVALSSLSAVERAQPLKIQVKTYTHYHSAARNKLAASSNTVTLALPQSYRINWTPQALHVSGFAGTMQGANVAVKSDQKIEHATFHVAAGLADMVTPAIEGETTLEANTPFTVPLAITIPAQKAPGTYTGTLELQVAGQTLAVMSLTVTVTSPTAAAIPSGIADPTPDRIASSTNDSPRLIKDEVVVGLTLDLANPDQRIKEIAAQTGGVIIGAIAQTHTYQLRFSVANLDGLKAKRDQLAGMADVSFATRNFASDSTTTPKDKEQPDSAWLDGNHSDRTWGQRYIKLPDAWNITTGKKSTKLGVIDTGLMPEHEDLKNNIVPTSDTTNIWTNIFRNGGTHGTEVSGVLCAEGNNNLGIAGVNWQCSLGLYNKQTGAPLLAFQDGFVTNAMYKMIAAAQDDMRVVNMSFGWNANKCEGPVVPNASERLAEATEINKSLAQAVVWAKGAHKDVLWVMAAGNACRDVQYIAPASLAHSFPENVMAVAAIKQTENSVANLEESSDFGGDIAVAAPGERIYTTKGVSAGVSTYDYDSGTSLAAPFVSGLAGLVLSAHSDYTATQVKQCILNAAEAFGHKINNQPFKVINAPEAVKCQKSTPSAGPTCVFERLVHPDGCESSNPTVQIDYFNSGSSCKREQVHITWNRNDPSTEEVFNVADVPVGGAKVLGTHTYPLIPGDYWIKEDITTNDGTSCLNLPLEYLFRLVRPV